MPVWYFFKQSLNSHNFLTFPNSPVPIQTNWRCMKWDTVQRSHIDILICLFSLKLVKNVAIIFNKCNVCRLGNKNPPPQIEKRRGTSLCAKYARQSPFSNSKTNPDVHLYKIPFFCIKLGNLFGILRSINGHQNELSVSLSHDQNRASISESRRRAICAWFCIEKFVFLFLHFHWFWLHKATEVWLG